VIETSHHRIETWNAALHPDNFTYTEPRYYELVEIKQN
jgi:hypothetical protein